MFCMLAMFSECDSNGDTRPLFMVIYCKRLDFMIHNNQTKHLDMRHFHALGNAETVALVLLYILLHKEMEQTDSGKCFLTECRVET